MQTNRNSRSLPPPPNRTPENEPVQVVEIRGVALANAIEAEIMGADHVLESLSRDLGIPLAAPASEFVNLCEPIPLDELDVFV